MDEPDSKLCPRPRPAVRRTAVSAAAAVLAVGVAVTCGDLVVAATIAVGVLAVAAAVAWPFRVEA